METFLFLAQSCLLTPKTQISNICTYHEYLYYFHHKESKKKKQKQKQNKKKGKS